MLDGRPQCFALSPPKNAIAFLDINLSHFSSVAVNETHTISSHAPATAPTLHCGRCSGNLFPGHCIIEAGVQTLKNRIQALRHQSCGLKKKKENKGGAHGSCGLKVPERMSQRTNDPLDLGPPCRCLFPCFFGGVRYRPGRGNGGFEIMRHTLQSLSAASKQRE